MRFVDTCERPCRKAFDTTQPLAAGFLSNYEILAILFNLNQSQPAKRGVAEEIALSKSVRTAIEDLAAADLQMTEILS